MKEKEFVKFFTSLEEEKRVFVF